MNIKTTLRFYFITVMVAIMKKKVKNNVVKGWRKNECLFTTDGSQYGTAFVNISMKVSHQCKNRASTNQAKPYLGIYL